MHFPTNSSADENESEIDEAPLLSVECPTTVPRNRLSRFQIQANLAVLVLLNLCNYMAEVQRWGC